MKEQNINAKFQYAGSHYVWDDKEVYISKRWKDELEKYESIIDTIPQITIIYAWHIFGTGYNTPLTYTNKDEIISMVDVFDKSHVQTCKDIR